MPTTIALSRQIRLMKNLWKINFLNPLNREQPHESRKSFLYSLIVHYIYYLTFILFLILFSLTFFSDRVWIVELNRDRRESSRLSGLNSLHSPSSSSLKRTANYVGAKSEQAPSRHTNLFYFYSE